MYSTIPAPAMLWCIRHTNTSIPSAPYQLYIVLEKLACLPLVLLPHYASSILLLASLAALDY